MEKVKNIRGIGKIAYKLRRQGKTIVTCNGSFDLMHIGHVMFLEQAKMQGDILIVGINTDSSIKKYKGVRRPIIPLKYRIRQVAALGCVDYAVALGGKEIGAPLIEAVRPDVHCTGAEYGKRCPEHEAIKKHKVRLFLIKRKIKISTTKILERIKEA